jgi:hypothetical protein
MLKYLLSLLLISVPVWNCLPAKATPVAPRTMASQVGSKPIATIRGKDLVHPTLSPDGKFLAYAEVIVENKRENTAVRILNLETQKSFLLISPKEAAKYKTYASYVSSMDWSQPDRLEVGISDGDVDTTMLTFDPFRKKLLATRYNGAGEIGPVEAKLRQRILAYFPKITQEALTEALIRSQRLETLEAVLLDGAILENERNLWLLNFEDRDSSGVAKPTIKRLFKADDPLAKARIESSKIARNGTFLLILVTDSNQRFLVVYKDGQIKKRQALAGIKGSTKILYAANNRILIMSYVFNTYEQGNNPLYIWNNGELSESHDYNQLYDAHVNSQGNRIAYCYWSRGKRQIVVKDLI